MGGFKIITILTVEIKEIKQTYCTAEISDIFDKILLDIRVISKSIKAKLKPVDYFKNFS